MSETRGLMSKAMVLGAAVVLGVAIIVMSVGGNVATAAKPRFVDNGDGTITDNATRLQWEKKSNTCPGVHCVTDFYTWSDATLSFISAVNDSSADGVTVTGLGGHSDWRLPTTAELSTIVDLSATGCGSGSPCIDPIFGPTAASTYWSSSSFASDPAGAWSVFFVNGLTLADIKTIFNYARAVRGGS